MTAIQSATRPTRRIVLLSALAAMIAMSSLMSSRTATSLFAQAQPKPTIVLVHGAWADASSWNGVIQQLEGLGYTVIAPANPLRGLAADAAYISSVLDTISGPVVLVGHSYGGAVISSAAAGHANVQALVYIAAFIPDVGEDGFSLVSRFPGSQLVPPGMPGATLIARPYPLAGGGTGTDLYIDPASFAPIFAADVAPDTAALMAATQRPVEASAFQEKARAAAWKSIPTWAMVATADNAIGTDNVRFMAQRAGATTVEIDASHAVLVSQPAAVAALIDDAARGGNP